MFGNKHTYCSVRFDDEKTYWYRTNAYGFRAGMNVIRSCVQSWLVEDRYDS